MKKNIIPKPHIYASCPIDGKIVDYYSSNFESVYVLLHPFVKPVKINSDCFYPETWPDKFEIIKNCEPIPWSKILHLGNFNNISEIDIALRTSIHGIKKKFRSDILENKLDNLLEEYDLIQPPEGDIPPLLENRLYNSIEKLGYTHLWIGDEFSTERTLYSIDKLKLNDLIPGHGNIFTNDEKLLVSTHWDSHCSFLCSSKDIIEKIIEENNYEGFYCSSNTQVYWGLYPI
ncbi:MAG: DUF2711 domain-containing protein [Spirochaetaceae bacterium]